MSTVLVTGAGGYIGRYVVSALIERDFDVIAADINDRGIDPRADFRQMDIFSGNKDLFRELGSPDSMIHMAWRDGFVHNSHSHIECLPLHFRFINDMLAGGLKQVAVMGTMHEVGYFEGEIDENTPANPLSLYGIAKNALRQSINVLQVQYPDVVFQWLRAYYIYGDDAFNHSIFAKIITAEHEGKKTFPLNSGNNRYDFIHVRELGRQIAAVVTQNRVRGVINCCTGEAIPLRNKVEEFIKEHGLNIRPEYGAFPDRPYDSPAIWGNPEKIREIMSEV